MLACPLRRSQRHPGIGKAWWPVQLQSSFFCLARKHRVHLSAALTTRGDSPKRNVGMSLEWQLDNINSVAPEDCVSLLPHVTERTDEVVPVQHRCGIVKTVRLVHCSHFFTFTFLVRLLRSILLKYCSLSLVSLRDPRGQSARKRASRWQHSRKRQL